MVISPATVQHAPLPKPGGTLSSASQVEAGDLGGHGQRCDPAISGVLWTLEVLGTRDRAWKAKEACLVITLQGPSQRILEGGAKARVQGVGSPFSVVRVSYDL